MYDNPENNLPVKTGAYGWWGRQSTIRKVGVVAGGVAFTGLTVWGIHRLMRADPIRDISEGCNDFAFANQAEVEEAIIPMLRSARTRTGSIDPFYVTTKFLKKFASECRSYPEEARNVGEADLYVQAFTKVVGAMEGERMLSPDQKEYFLQMVSVWGRAQGLTDAQLPVSQTSASGAPAGPGPGGPGGATIGTAGPQFI